MECLEDFLDARVEMPKFNLFYVQENKLKEVIMCCKSYFFNQESEAIEFIKNKVDEVVFCHHVERFNNGEIMIRCDFHKPIPGCEYVGNWWVALVREKKIKQILDE